MIVSRWPISLLLLVGSNFFASADEDLLWSGPGRILDPGETVYAQDGNCKLTMQDDGNLVMRRRIGGIDDEPTAFPISWTSGTEFGDVVPYALELTPAGNMEINNLDSPASSPEWTTNVIGDSSATLDVVIDGACRLKLQHDSVDVWENIKVPPFKAGQVLQKGDMFRMSILVGQAGLIQGTFSIHYVLALQHDCNLVQYIGTDEADRGTAIWSSQTPRLEADNCYLYLDKGKAVLHEGSFDPSLSLGAERPGAYWSTPSGWLDTNMYNQEIQESYSVVLDSDGSSFGWRCCNLEPFNP